MKRKRTIVWLAMIGAIALLLTLVFLIEVTR